MTRIYITSKGDCVSVPESEFAEIERLATTCRAFRRLASRRIETTTPIPAWMTPQLSPPVGGGEGNGDTK